MTTSLRWPVEPDTADRLSEQLEGLELDDLFRRVIELIEPEKLAVVSAFGPGSLVLIHTLHRLQIRLPVIFIDTLHHFPETIEQVHRVSDRYDLDLRIYRHCDSREEFEQRYGARLWETDLDRYQRLSKVEPFQRATADLDAWFTGRRRQQSEMRSELTLVDGDGSSLRVNPLLDWTRSQVWHYLLDNEIPYNPLHDQGFSSIGDEPLTTAVGLGEEERAGRWRGAERTECGIHSI